MQHSGLRIGRILITAQLLLYSMFTFIVISGAILNILLLASSILEILTIGLLSLLAGIGLLAIIWEVVKRSYLVGGAIFLALCIFTIFSILFNYKEELGLFNEPTYILVLAFLLQCLYAVTGLIIVLRGKNLLLTNRESK